MKPRGVRFCLVLGCLLAASIDACWAQPPTFREWWDQIASYRFAEAAAAIPPDAAAEPRRAALGQALLQLTRQPRTEAGLAEARGGLAALVAPRLGDEVELAAWYQLGRWEQFYGGKEGASRAVTVFLDLRAAHPGKSLAQIGAVKACLLALTNGPGGPEGAANLAEWEARGAWFSDEAAAREYHLVMGEAWWILGRDAARAYAHLTAAERAGVLRSQHRADLLAQLGGLARELGRTADAIRHYETFVVEFPRDARADMVRRRAAGLRQEAKP